MSPPDGGEDVRALAELSTAYAAAADDRDGDALASLFLPDGVLMVPDVPTDLRPVLTRTGAAIRQIPNRLSRCARTFHQTTDHRFEVDGDRATGEVRCVAHHVVAHNPDDPVVTGAGNDTVWFIRYRDRYVRTDGGWRIERRELHLQWVEERPVALLAAGSVD